MEYWERAYSRVNSRRTIKNYAVKGGQTMKGKIARKFSAIKEKFRNTVENAKARRRMKANIKENSEDIGKIVDCKKKIQERLNSIRKPREDSINDKNETIKELEYQIEIGELTEEEENDKKEQIAQLKEQIKEIEKQAKTAEEIDLETAEAKCNELGRLIANGEEIENLDEILERLENSEIIPIQEATVKTEIYRHANHTKTTPITKVPPVSSSAKTVPIPPVSSSAKTVPISPVSSSIKTVPPVNSSEKTEPLPKAQQEKEIKETDKINASQLPTATNFNSGLQIYNKVLQNVGYIKGTKAITAHDWLSKFGIIGKLPAAIIRKATDRNGEIDRIIEELDTLDPKEFNLLMEEFLIKDNDSVNAIRFKVNEIFLEAVEKKCTTDFNKFEPSLQKLEQRYDKQIEEINKKLSSEKNEQQKINLVEQQKIFEQAKNEVHDRRQQLERRPRAIKKAKEDKSLDKKNNIKGKTRAVRNPDNREEVAEAARIELSILEAEDRASKAEKSAIEYHKKRKDISLKIIDTLNEDKLFKGKHVNPEQKKEWEEQKAKLEKEQQKYYNMEKQAKAEQTAAKNDFVTAKQEFDSYLGENTEYEFNRKGKIKRSIGKFEAPKGEITVISNQKYIAPEVLHAAGLATVVATTQAAMLLGQQVHTSQNTTYEGTNTQLEALKEQITNQNTIDTANDSLYVDAYNVHAYGERAATLGANFNISDPSYGTLDAEGVNRANEAASQIQSDHSSLSEILANKAQIAREGEQEGLNRVSELANNYYSTHNTVSGAGVDHGIVAELETNIGSHAGSQADLYEVMANLAKQIENADSTTVETIAEQTGIDLKPLLLTLVPSAVRVTKDVVENRAEKRESSVEIQEKEEEER